jgi:RimJ/RimL family protein N-acetyltransferase
VHIARLNPSDRFTLVQLLLQRPLDNLVPLGILAATGMAPDVDTRWEGAWAARGSRRLVAALLRSGRMPGGWAAAVPAGDLEACRALGEHARGDALGFMLAALPQADALWAGLGSPVTRIWTDHRLYVCDRVSEGRRLTLRRARRAELERMARIAAEMEQEDLGADVFGLDEEAHRADVARKIGEGRVWVGEIDGEVVFKGDVGLVSGMGALIGGMWVSPGARGQGLGAAGVRALTAQLLASAPVVGLHVREDNPAAIRAYLSAGYREDAPFRLAVSLPSEEG